MAAQRSVGRFCSVLTKDLTTLANINATNLGSGAEVFVLSTARSYRLIPSVLGTHSPVTIAAAGGAGTWVQVNAINDQSFFIFALTSTANIFPTINVWSALPTFSGGQYGADAAKAFWSLDAPSGVVTYNGPTAVFLVQANISFFGQAPLESWEFSLSRNGALNGTTSADALSSRADTDEADLGFCSIISPVTITPAGTTYQTVVRPLDSSGTAFRLTKYQLSFMLLPG